MVRRYDFGSPWTTGSVVETVRAEEGPVPYFSVSREGGRVSFTIALDEDDMIFGLGETVRGINKRGHRYRAWNSDDFSHTENKQSLYASHNLALFFGTDKCFGVYVDDPGAVVFDLGFTRRSQAVITSENGDFSLYVLDGESMTDICRQFRRLTGRSYLPPKWGMGYIQSRWGYASQEDARTVVEQHRRRHIPLDGFSMDIDYMDDYKDFTWHPERFPDLPGLVEDMRAKHVRLIPIIDAGVKKDGEYDVCREGLEKGYFCRKADGTPFVGAVWPGRSLFPDFLRGEVRAWFGGQYKALLDAGVEGFWNDMNEPALFYSEEGLAEAYAVADRLRASAMGNDEVNELKDAFARIANNPDDYKRFYHELDGRTVRHDKVHNLYGMYMTRAAAEGFKAYDPGKRFLLFARSSFIGAHRYGGVWQGDNNAWWSHLLLNLKMMPSLNMAGFLFCGADLGGFGCDTTEDLLQRWLQLGVFTPLMRNHAACGTRDQEIYRFDNWMQMRDTLTVRYALLPYLYSELMQAALTDGMMFRPLAFDYPHDTTACRTEDQVMLGHDCMIAPVYEQNACGRHVYLPEDMLLVRFRSAVDYDLVPVPAGHCWINLKINEFPLFVRKGHVIPLGESAEYVEGVNWKRFKLLGWLENDVDVYAPFYDDDGVCIAPELESGLTRLVVKVTEGHAHAEAAGLELDAAQLLID